MYDALNGKEKIKHNRKIKNEQKTKEKKKTKKNLKEQGLTECDAHTHETMSESKPERPQYEKPV